MKSQKFCCELNVRYESMIDNLQEQVKELKRERDVWKRKAELPMKYKRMTYNAELQKEIEELKAQAGEPFGYLRQTSSDTNPPHGWAFHFTKRNGDVPVFTHPTTEPVKAQAGEPVTWGVDWGRNGDQSCVSIVKKHQDGTLEVVACEYEPHPTTERRVVPEDVRKVMEMALIVLERHPYKSWQGVTETITALRNALNAAPAKGEV